MFLSISDFPYVRKSEIVEIAIEIIKDVWKHMLGVRLLRRERGRLL